MLTLVLALALTIACIGENGDIGWKDPWETWEDWEISAAPPLIASTELPVSVNKRAEEMVW